VLHLLYARFWHKVLFDLGVVHTPEPFQKLVNQGMILGYNYRFYDDNVRDLPDVQADLFASTEVRVEGERVTSADGRELKARWVSATQVRRTAEGVPVHPIAPDLELEEVLEKMSKSRGNVISPDEVVAEYGADSMRLYEMFLGPLEKEAPWSTEGIQGVWRFLERVWRTLLEEEVEGEPLRSLVPGDGTPAQARLAAKTIQGVTEDLEAMRFNTAISKLMVFAREIARDAPLPRRAAETLVLLLAPLAPHVAEELWERLGGQESLARAAWPEPDPAQLEEDVVRLVVQVNGKRRDEIQVPSDASEEAVREAALACEKVQRHLDGKAPRRVIVVPGRLVNVVG
jgi:leucyl-tRNA synthetase